MTIGREHPSVSRGGPAASERTRLLVGAGDVFARAAIHDVAIHGSGGIRVSSAAGRGSTVEVGLPALAPPPEASRMSDTGPPRGAETVLVVEDEEPVRELIGDVLRLQGFTVLEAWDGEEALLVAERHQEAIDLIVVDVVIPGVAAPDLVQRLQAARPTLRALYISGYTGDLVGQHGLLQAGQHFLQKPFSLDALTRKVREVLDAE